MSSDVQWFLTFVGTLLVGGVAVYTARALRRKYDGEGAASLSAAVADLIGPLRKELHEVRVELEAEKKARQELTREVRLIEQWAKLLFTQVLESGGEPIPFERVRELYGE